MNLEHEISIAVTCENENITLGVHQLIMSAVQSAFFIVDKDNDPKSVMRLIIVPLTQHNFLELRNNNYLPVMEN